MCFEHHSFSNPTASMRTYLTIPAALVFTCMQIEGAFIPIVNSGFESDPLATGGWSNNVPTGWNDPQGADNTNFIENIAGFSSDGVMHVGFDANEFGMIYQDLSVAWAPNTTYTFTVGVGNRAGTGAGIGRFGLGSSLDPLSPSGPNPDGPYSLQTPSVSFWDFDTATVVPDIGSHYFMDTAFTYTTGAVAPSGNIRISVQEISGTRIHVDNFRLDAVPEPSSLATLCAAAGLLMRRRRARA